MAGDRTVPHNTVQDAVRDRLISIPDFTATLARPLVSSHVDARPAEDGCMDTKRVAAQRQR